MIAAVTTAILGATPNALHAQETFSYMGVERTYYLDAPAEPSLGAPLVFVLHGYGGSASSIRSYTGWDAIAANEGPVVCYPQGTLDFNGTTHWNANFGISPANDHGFLVALAEHLQETYNLSPECTYACGMSNGGYMSYSLACEAPETFRAVGSVTGAMSEYDFDNCDPSEAVPVIHLHGTADFNVSYTNGVGSGPWGDEGVEEIMDLWTGFMGTTLSEETELPNLEAVDVTSVDFIRHYGAPNGQEFHHYRVNGGGHQWFGVWGSQDIQSTQLLWEFFQSQCAGEFSSVATETEPEPECVEWNGQGLTVLSPCAVRIFDVQGRLVWNWPNASAGLVLSRTQLSGSHIVNATAPDGRAQVIRLQ